MNEIFEGGTEGVRVNEQRLAEEMRRLQRDRLTEEVDDGGPHIAVWLLGMAAISLLGGLLWVLGMLPW